MTSLHKPLSLQKIFQVVVVLVGLISGSLAIYTYYFSKAEIEFQIVNSFNVYDLNEELGKLDFSSCSLFADRKLPDNYCI